MKPVFVAIDTPDIDGAGEIARAVAHDAGGLKLGLEFFCSNGPEGVRRMGELGLPLFLDVKLHDIPNTVGRAARVLGRHGVDFLNFHAAGGEAMLRAGVEGLAEGAREAGHARPVALAVTVLTSDPNVDAMDARLDAARASGCDGVVCAGSDVERARARALRTMVPGIRLAGDDANDQARVDTPRDAIARGADWLVIGRSVTGADDPERAAAEVARAVAEGLALSVS